MPNRVLFTACVIILTLLSACSSNKATDYEQISENDKIVIRFSHVVGEDTPKGQAARLFAKLVKERTKGKVEVQVFSNSSLYKDSEELEALAQGRVQMIAPALSKLSDLVPELGVFDLPYLYSDLDGYHKVFDGKIGSLIADSVESKNMVSLAFWDSGFKQFTSNLRPIRKPEDLTGSTMRIMPSSVLDQQFSLLRVNPVQINFNDVYLALEQGKIHGQENTISNIYSKRFYRVQKYMTLSDHGYLGYLVVIDKKFWNRLPVEIQKVIKETMNEVTAWQRNQAVQIEKDKLKEIQDCRCIEITGLTADEKAAWRQLFRPLYQEMEQRLGSTFFSELQLQP
ncbi:DctP family TRAP transporter solute-binding subunit [Effusibacillus lacus]|uniref:DctP family TRAP transporter solute-binding subunit n=1 Tax=Effusibacillus lacus TaxID=1348429 RepID=UPI001C129978|nr:DctP family TRAP transporter solute-binding subunit [Effusibacillus lacus]